METNQSSGSHKGLAIISYISILVVIPLINNKGDNFVKFHSKQGLVLFIAWLAANLILRLLNLEGFIASIVHLVYLIFMLIGIYHAANGEMKELPVIGKFSSQF